MLFVFLGEYMVPGPVGEAPLVAAVLVVEVLRQLLDHLEVPGLVLVVAVAHLGLDDILVRRPKVRKIDARRSFGIFSGVVAVPFIY